MDKILNKTYKIVIFVFIFVFAMQAKSFVFAQSQELSTGSLVSISGESAVYYFAEDEQMYVFPNEATYFSWYDDFSQVQVISSDVFYRYTIGGLVKYHPGKVMVKIPSNSRVYAVTYNGELRWINQASLVEYFYGKNWRYLIDDMPDSIFTNYRIGEVIDQKTDYNPDRELRAVPSINHNLGFLPKSALEAPETDDLALQCDFLEDATETLQMRAIRYKWDIWDLGDDYEDLCGVSISTPPPVQGQPVRVSQVRISPLNVGVFVESTSQQFKLEGLDMNGQWVDITPFASWGLSNYNLPTQTKGANEIMSINRDGLVMLKETWGRARVNACYPSGCQPNSIQPSVMNANTSITIVNVSTWGYWLGDSVSPNIPLDQYKCMSVPEVRYYQVTEHLFNSNFGSFLTWQLDPGSTFYTGWGKLWTISSRDGGKTYSAFAWDWITLDTPMKPLGGVDSIMADPWRGTMVSTICDHRECNDNADHTQCNGRRRSTINFTY